jgi:glycosyltransferase involved in cell wall biosynthesis
MKRDRSPKIRLLFLVNVDWFFLSHRLPVALAAKEAGYDVWVAAADSGKGEVIRSHGFHYIPLSISRSGQAFWSELRIFIYILNLYRKVKPDLVHHVTIKPVLYGSLVSKFFPKMAVINAVTGMGFVFSGDKKASGLKNFVTLAFRMAFSKKKLKIVFQNEADRNVFLKSKLIKPEKTLLIRGSGVDCNIYKPVAQSKTDSEHPIVLLASRTIWDKGIAEYTEAARIVKRKFPDVRFLLAGLVDEGNPNVVPESLLTDWHNEGIIEWLGHIDDMAELISKASIVALPTFYPEGVPKILIEAAASGKAIVTTNRPGCNDIVKHGVNGLLVSERDSIELASAIMKLLNAPELMENMGKAGREMVLNEFDVKIVIRETLNLYKQMLAL